MKNKYLTIFLFILLIFSSLSLISSQTGLEDLEKSAESIEKNTEKLEEGIEKAQDLDKYGRWDYLGPEIQKMVMENRYVDYFFNEQDGLFFKADIVFVILFGEHYSFSIGLVVLIILWFYIFIQLSGVLRDFSMFSNGTSIIIGLGLTTAFAQFNLLSLIVQGLGWLIASPDAWWVRSLVGLAIVLFFILFIRARIALGKIEKQIKEKEAETREKINRHYLDMTVEAIKKGFGFK
jgi:hypothetical protein